jgi:hypothetical protein
MTVLKAGARLLGADGATLGEGRAYVHLRAERDVRQACQGTLSLDWWEPTGPAPATLVLENGPTLSIVVDSDRLSGCVVGRILRYQTTCPGEGST